jgi:hypothetical protein
MLPMTTQDTKPTVRLFAWLDIKIGVYTGADQ